MFDLVRILERKNSMRLSLLISELEDSPRVWNGTKKRGGWVIIPPESYKGRRFNKCYAYQSRVIASYVLGRPLESFEVVIHKNRNTKDNRVENLFVGDKSDMAAWQHLNLPKNSKCKRCKRAFRVLPKEKLRKGRGQYCCAGCWRKADTYRQAAKDSFSYQRKFQMYKKRFERVIGI